MSFGTPGIESLGAVAVFLEAAVGWESLLKFIDFFIKVPSTFQRLLRFRHWRMGYMFNRLPAATFIVVPTLKPPVLNGVLFQKSRTFFLNSGQVSSMASPKALTG